MIEWFQTTFATASEQARLFSIVVSTCLAITLLLLNQWFVNNRTKREYKLSKIEEFSKSIYAYERMALYILSALYSHASPRDKEILNKLSELSELVQKIEMLAELYFPNIKMNTTEFLSPVVDLHDSFCALENEGIIPLKNHLLYSEAEEKVKKVLEGVKHGAKSLTKKHT